MARPSNGELDGMSYKDLLTLQEQIAVAIVQRRKSEREAVKAQIAALAAEKGMSLQEVLGTKGATGKGSKGTAAVKYRNPENPDETWSGRGRMAKWLAEKIKKRGVKIEDFLA